MPADALIVPEPEPPDSPDAWYATGIYDHYEIVPGVVATVTDGKNGFAYRVREPSLSARTTADLRVVREHFENAELRRPRTREGAAERFHEGFDPSYERILDRLVSCRPAARRRLEYYALAELHCLGDLTPHALDDEIEIVDASGEELSVHLTDYAPADTGIEDAPYMDRVGAERIERYTVTFLGYEIPVVRYREQLLGADPFERKYAVLEPALLPGEERHIDGCKEHVWKTGVGALDGRSPIEERASIVCERSEQFLSRRLTAGSPRALIDTLGHRVRRALAEYGGSVPSVDRRYTERRLDALVYYVVRDLVGYGQLTVPICDPNLEDIEANRVGERIKVVPRGSGREPTNLAFDSETEFVNVATKLAASDGVELSASRPSAKTNLDLDGLDQTVRCAIALPTISEGGPHISIRKQASNVLTPVDLVESDSLPTELVALLWMLYEHHGVVLYSGPTGAGKTTLLNAHMPFIAYDARPVSIDEGSREVRLPHETGVSLTTREHQDRFKNISMSELMAETNYLNPDVEVIAEINSAESFGTLGEVLQTGHGVLGTTHAENIETLLGRLMDKGVPPRLLFEIDLVVFPEHGPEGRHVGSAVELLPEREAERLDRPTGSVTTDGVTVHYNRVVTRTSDGGWEFAYEHPKLGDPTANRGIETFDRLAAHTNRPLEAVEAEFHRKHGYVEYLVRDGISDFEALFGFLSDLRTNEAATIERIRRTRVDPDA